MSNTQAGPFEHVAKTPGGNFILYLYAAIYRLLRQVNYLSEVGGSDLEALFKDYHFLSEYFMEMRQYMPEDISWDEGSGWWREQIQLWEKDCEAHLPLRALIEEGRLSFESTLAFMVTGLVEEDSRFGTLFAELQAPLSHRRPTLELVGQMMIDEAMVGESDPWVVCRPLLVAGLVEAANKLDPRSEWLLRVPPFLWDAARGEVEKKPISWLTFHQQDNAPDVESLILDDVLRKRLSSLPSLIQANITQMIILRGSIGSNAQEVVGAVARVLSLNVLSVDAALLDDNEDMQFPMQSFGAFCTMTHSMPLFNYDLAPGETASLPELKGYQGPVAVFMGREGGLSSQDNKKAVTLYLPAPDASLREKFWLQALAGREIENLQNVVQRFQLSGDYIRQVADIAVAQAGMDGRAVLKSDDVREAARTLNRQMLDTLADYLEPRGHWSDLVTIESTDTRLRELQKRCDFREKITGHLGPAFGSSTNRGVRALFTGVSGTGKTLAARILASELGMDLYRVDLAAIINKYIGETEKNLHRILSRAEALDVVLLLDEGDALLGQRTDVKSANDRYANLETNYLLQRLENYQGIVLITTNLVENVDRAFQRRMDVVVPFLSPQAQERLRILELHLPEDHLVDTYYLEQVALRCRLNGGQIRSTAMHAALLALDDETQLARYHLETALRSEYRKAGGTFPLEGLDDINARHTGMDELMSALSNQ
ncbi:MAG TPA: AAA family ATPase [Gammaproteobacteria bacterium]|nr:AAA family ATPase [Gammaproteobacteria bacterium]